MKKFFSDILWGSISLIALILLSPEEYDNYSSQDNCKTWDKCEGELL